MKLNCLHLQFVQGDQIETHFLHFPTKSSDSLGNGYVHSGTPAFLCQILSPGFYFSKESGQAQNLGMYYQKFIKILHLMTMWKDLILKQCMVT